MAIPMFPESPNLGTSPRISFSHDLRHTDDVVPIEHYPCRSDSSLLDSTPDFNFCITDCIENEPSSADELFSDGLIRPLQIQQRFVCSKQHISISKVKPQSSSSLPFSSSSKQDGLKDVTATTFDQSEPKPQSKSFWGIKRSSSLHCDNTYKKSSIWSLPLLSRSNSTGSVPNSKRVFASSSSKDCQKHNSQKQPKSVSSSNFYMYPSSQKPPLKKNYGGSYGNGLRIIPVLNVPVPPPYISKGTANLFGTFFLRL
ncbi:hypothetical protein F0562_023878 [Nyssa sinensis]|uniref:Uncharacterized protein n=1 Tax=Nyssa sinensis TaxID=561372 RepID=A0A5J5BJ89_9ASTE|nr:hypothetical protein F0562_023878 [Nyssa sinensis]